jgi:hypothetical protein
MRYPLFCQIFSSMRLFGKKADELCVDLLKENKHFKFY